MIRSASEWKAINSPVRVEMVVFLIAAGVCAIRELAALMNRPADGLYHHMRILVGAGLVEAVGVRRVGKQQETLYRTTARDIAVDRNIKNTGTRARTTRLFRTILLNAHRTLAAALDSGTAVLEGPRQNLKFNWLASWLDDVQLARVRSHQEAINNILRTGARRRKGQLVAVLTYMAPVRRTRGARPLTD